MTNEKGRGLLLIRALWFLLLVLLSLLLADVAVVVKLRTLHITAKGFVAGGPRRQLLTTIFLRATMTLDVVRLVDRRTDALRGVGDHEFARETCRPENRHDVIIDLGPKIARLGSPEEDLVDLVTFVLDEAGADLQGIGKLVIPAVDTLDALVLLELGVGVEFVEIAHGECHAVLGLNFERETDFRDTFVADLEASHHAVLVEDVDVRALGHLDEAGLGDPIVADDLGAIVHFHIRMEVDQVLNVLDRGLHHHVVDAVDGGPGDAREANLVHIDEAHPSHHALATVDLVEERRIPVKGTEIRATDLDLEAVLLLHDRYANRRRTDTVEGESVRRKIAIFLHGTRERGALALETMAVVIGNLASEHGKPPLK